MKTQFYVQQALQQLEMAINATPSGEIRNKLTEANIYLMEAESMVRAASVKGA